jgi:hypothetical protein
MTPGKERLAGGWLAQPDPTIVSATAAAANEIFMEIPQSPFER